MQGAKIIFRDNKCIVAVSPIISENQLNDVINYSDIPGINAKSIKRRCEWATTHKLLEFVLGETVTYSYDKNGKPVLNNRNEKISISHSRNFCAVIISKIKHAGIDIEEPNDRIYRIADRFLTEDEKVWVDGSPDKIEVLYLIWCAKEALYKVTDLKPDFKENMFIEKKSILKSGEINARLCINNLNKSFRLFYCKTEKYIIVFTIN